MESKLIKQFNGIKEKYPDALLLIRSGDFYQSFNQDAEQISNLLNIPLVKKNCEEKDYLVTGFTFYSLDTYLPKLVRAGNRVAICDQIT